MMKSSRILIGSAVLALGTMLAWGASPATSAQPATATMARQGRQMRSPAEMAKMMTDRIDKAVTLNDDQKAKIEAIYEKAFTDMAANRASGDMSKNREVMGQATKDAQALCTPDQVAKWPAMGRGRRGGGGGL
ncbi:MAG TPA: hypothetical protein VMV31_01775 [Terriglobales bacterium]|nr:hypothetical protein [Terriglobales bacterium]